MELLACPGPANLGLQLLGDLHQSVSALPLEKEGGRSSVWQVLVCRARCGAFGHLHSNMLCLIVC